MTLFYLDAVPVWLPVATVLSLMLVPVYANQSLAVLRAKNALRSYFELHPSKAKQHKVGKTWIAVAVILTVLYVLVIFVFELNVTRGDSEAQFNMHRGMLIGFVLGGIAAGLSLVAKDMDMVQRQTIVPHSVVLCVGSDYKPKSWRHLHVLKQNPFLYVSSIISAIIFVVSIAPGELGKATIAIVVTHAFSVARVYRPPSVGFKSLSFIKLFATLVCMVLFHILATIPGALIEYSGWSRHKHLELPGEKETDMMFMTVFLPLLWLCEAQLLGALAMFAYRFDANVAGLDEPTEEENAAAFAMIDKKADNALLPVSAVAQPAPFATPVYSTLKTAVIVCTLFYSVVTSLLPSKSLAYLLLIQLSPLTLAAILFPIMMAVKVSKNNVSLWRYREKWTIDQPVSDAIDAELAQPLIEDLPPARDEKAKDAL